MEREIERFLAHVAGAKPHPCYMHSSVWEPPVNVYLTADAVVVVAELAGADKESIDVSVEGDRLLLRGHRCEPPLPGLVSHHQVEVHFGKFERQVRLPGPVEPGGTKAAYEQGLLRVAIPLVRPRRLTVETESEAK